MEIKELILNHIANLTPREAAKLYDTSPGIIGLWRKGTQDPNQKHCQIYLRKYASALIAAPVAPAEPQATLAPAAEENVPEEQPGPELDAFDEPVQPVSAPAVVEKPNLQDQDRVYVRRPIAPEPFLSKEQPVVNAAGEQVRAPKGPTMVSALGQPINPATVQIPVRQPQQVQTVVLKPNQQLVMKELPPAEIEKDNAAAIALLPSATPPEPKKGGVSICFPCYRQTNPLTTFCLIAIVKQRPNYHFILEFNTELVKARNLLAHRFLHETDDEYSFWLDDDMVCPIGNAGWWKRNVVAPIDYPDVYAGMHSVQRLHSHGKKIISGLYYGRNSLGTAMYKEAILDPAENQRAHQNVPRNILRPTNGIAAGFMLVHRDVFIDIQNQNPMQDEPTLVNPYPFFNRVANEGEDMAFSNRARAAGHPLFVDMGCIAAHLGTGIYGPWNTRVKEIV